MVSAIRHSAATDIIIVESDEVVLRARYRRRLFDIAVAGLLGGVLWIFFLIGETSTRTIHEMGWYIAGIILLGPPALFFGALYAHLRSRRPVSRPMLILSADGLELSWLGADAILLPWPDIEVAAVFDQRRRWRGTGDFMEVCLKVDRKWSSQFTRLLPRRGRIIRQDFAILRLRGACRFPTSLDMYGPLQVEPLDLLYLLGLYIPVQDLPQDYRPVHPALASLTPRQTRWEPVFPLGEMHH